MSVKHAQTRRFRSSICARFIKPDWSLQVKNRHKLSIFSMFATDSQTHASILLTFTDVEVRFTAMASWKTIFSPFDKLTNNELFKAQTYWWYIHSSILARTPCICCYFLRRKINSIVLFIAGYVLLPRFEYLWYFNIMDADTLRLEKHDIATLHEVWIHISL